MLKNHNRGVGAVAVFLLTAFVFSLLFVRPSTEPAQAAVITPIAQTGRDGSRVAQYFVSQAITTDTRVCFDLADYEIMDLQYQVVVSDSNPTTLTLQQTNIDPASGPFNAASAIATVAATPAAANVMAQLPLFGRWNCVLADVTNTNPITFTVIGVAK